MAVATGVDAIVHAGFADDSAAAIMRERPVVLVPTLTSFAQAGSAPFTRALFDRTRELIARGVPVVVGTDAGVIPHGENVAELRSLVEFGM